MHKNLLKVMMISTMLFTTVPTASISPVYAAEVEAQETEAETVLACSFNFSKSFYIILILLSS